ncbi:hypothetical protein P308_24310 [Pseudomonas piscis]|nr:hypothetical protein P308_24310 [Pseudomonas piscis]
MRDCLHAVVNEGLNAIGLLALPGLAMLLAHDGLWPRDWPLWGQLLLAVTVADCGITLAHYASHRWAWLWRLHAVHHSVQRMYGFNGLLKHPLHQLLEASAGLLPLLMLGIPLPVAQLLALAIAIQLLLQHSNVDMRLGVLRLVFAWAPVHRFHHMKYGRAGDVNFGLFFNLWDWLLGTTFYRHDYPMRPGDLGIGSVRTTRRGTGGNCWSPSRSSVTAPSPRCRKPCVGRSSQQAGPEMLEGLAGGDAE